MLTVSIVSPWTDGRIRFVSSMLCAALFSFLFIGCLAPPTVVVDDLLQPLVRAPLWVPEDADFAAAKLARAALLSKPEGNPRFAFSRDSALKNSNEFKKNVTPSVPAAIESALAAVRAAAPSSRAPHLVPLSIDLRNTTLDDPIAYRASARELRKRGGLDPRIRSRLDRTIDDDPILLARRRQFDGWHRLWARTFNAISAPLGSSVITGFVLAPFQLANSIIHYFADFSNEEALSLTDRQALVLRQEFLRKHPHTELTAQLELKIEKSTIRLEETLALRRIRVAEGAFDEGNLSIAAYQADSAGRILSPHPKKNPILRRRSERVAEKVEKAITVDRNRRLTSLKSHAIDNGPVARIKTETSLARALLVEPINSPLIAQRIAAYHSVAGDGDDGSGGPTEFILAIRQHENGYDVEARRRLSTLASLGPIDNPMARHAKALLDDDWQNPHGAFERLERQAVREEFAWRVAGEWVRRTRYPNLPTPLAYLIDTPTIAITMILAPLRALTSPWTGSPDFRRAPALAGYRYLQRFPDGSNQQPLVEWLYNYERDEERWGRALRLADFIPNFDSEERLELVDKTTQSRLDLVDRLDRRDNRASVLKGVAREFPDSEGGREAGLRAREEAEDASPQHIRITKSFMLENPEVAGPNGLGLNPSLLNDDDADGELHPDGVLLRGGRVLEILLIAEGGDDKDPPESRHRKISRQRLSHVASALGEAIAQNSLIDVGARQSSDAGRDVYLERANLGLTDDVDQRPTAESTHVYQSLRERYGLVRGRDSILPFDLVFRGSLGDFTLGAFPRWRPPRETPDAFLYR